MGGRDPHLAARNGNLVDLRHFLHEGGDVNQRGLDQKTPLHEAAQYGQIAVIRELLHSGCLLEGEDNKGFTPLHRAVYFGQIEATRVLVQEGGVDPTAANGQGHKPGDGGFERSVSQDTRERLRGILAHAKRKRSVQANAAAETMSDGFSVFAKAEAGDEAAVAATQRFLNSGGNVNSTENGLTLLHCAARSGHAELCRFLLSERASVDLEGGRAKETPLQIAAIWGYAEVCRLLLQHGAKADHANTAQQTSLLCAAKKGSKDVVVVLLNGGADVSAVDADRNTPLHAACHGGKAAVVEVLLNAGANPLLRNKRGEQPGELFESGVPVAQRRAVLVLMKPANEKWEQQQLQQQVGAAGKGRGGGVHAGDDISNGEKLGAGAAGDANGGVTTESVRVEVGKSSEEMAGKEASSTVTGKKADGCRCVVS